MAGTYIYTIQILFSLPTTLDYTPELVHVFGSYYGVLSNVEYFSRLNTVTGNIIYYHNIEYVSTTIFDSGVNKLLLHIGFFVSLYLIIRH